MVGFFLEKTFRAGNSALLDCKLSLRSIALLIVGYDTN